jgi:hypothetical protein
VEQASQATQLEYVELAAALDLLAERAPVADATELVEVWPELEQRVLDRVSVDAYDNGNTARDSAGAKHWEAERIRNLAWEVGVSVDLHAVHLGALRALANLLRERGQRFAMRALQERSARSVVGRADSNPG